MKKAFVFLIVFAMLLSFAACFGKTDGDPKIDPEPATETEETTVLALPDPAANVNPEDMDWGWNDYAEEKFENETSDIWYPAEIGKNDADYMYFHNGHSVYKVSGGEEKSAGWVLSDDNHMIADPEYSEFEFDIVFMDNFTLYDYVTKTYYTRGDQSEYGKKFIGATFTCKTDSERSMLLREDGTAEYTYRGEGEECTWEVIAQRIIRLKFADYDDDYYIFYDANGEVECISEDPYSLDNAYVMDYPER